MPLRARRSGRQRQDCQLQHFGGQVSDSADQHFRYYWVEFQSEKVEGLTDCEAGPIKLKIFSRAITWTPLGEGNHGTLTIKDANGNFAQAMTAAGPTR